jgi:hypothetical protein
LVVRSGAINKILTTLATRDGGVGVADFTYRDINGVSRTLRQANIDPSKVPVFDTWYIIRFDYDLLKSEFRWRLFNDNGSKLIDIEWQDISTETPELFSETEIKFVITGKSFTSGVYVEHLIDYVKAPFKEREWNNFDVGGAQFITQTPVGVVCEDNIDDASQFRLTVPYLDAFSGTMLISTTDSSAMVDNEYMLMTMTVFAVDADDGGLHEAVQINYRYEEQMAPFTGPGYSIIIKVDGVQVFNTAWAEDEDEYNSCYFNVYSREDRSKLFVSMTYASSADVHNSFIGDVAISDVADDPSQEFVLSMYYEVDFDSDIEMTGALTDIQIIERDIVKDFVGWVGSVADDVGKSLNSGFDWFLSIFRWLASAIINVLNFMLDVLLAGLVAIGTVIDTISTNIGTLITELQGLADDIATSIWTGIETTLDFLFDAIDGIWTALIAILDDILAQLLILAEDVAVFVFAAIEFLVVLLLDIIEELWTIIEELGFFIWDAIGLPDVLALGNELLAYFIEVINWTLTTFQDVIVLTADLSWLILVLWWGWAVPIQWARAEFNPLGGIANFIEVYFYDALPWSILGFHIYIPQGIVFTLWLILLLPADFAIFGAMGL